MKIVVDETSTLRARTGVRTYVDNLLEILPRIAPEHTVVCIRPTVARSSGTTAAAKIANHLLELWWSQIELPIRARRSGADVLLCPEYVAPLVHPCPTAVLFYDAYFWANPAHYNRWWRLLQNLVTAPAARRASRVLTISQFARAEVIRLLKFDPSRVYAIPLAAAPPIDPSPSEEARALDRLGLTESPYVLHVGVLEIRKNLPALVRAFAEAAQYLPPESKLVLAGPPGPKRNLDDSSSIVDAVSLTGLGERVVLPGFLSKREIAALYRHARVVAFPSLGEGFGLPVLEAFGYGVPVVASRAAAVPEVAGDAALLVDATDTTQLALALRRAWLDEPLRAELVLRGKARAAEYSWESTMRQTVRMLERMTGPRAGAIPFS